MVDCAEPQSCFPVGMMMGVQPKFREKAFYKIGEVSEITKLPSSVLRFWESEFSFLRPRKSQGRHRVYDRHTIETVLEIKRMLYEEGYTISGLKRHWNRRRQSTDHVNPSRERVERAKSELQYILGLLKTHEKEP